ncbi:unnamed protein product [Cyclocybe aegerita]|uniref:Flavin-containing monooxygenase n=1 Tax=Cyclocybe aegerita TaxID=1973307 RepID=A0A8S0XS23_CYCAE|nr:unnamed protein product [Cyclocybe aegerita]
MAFSSFSFPPSTPLFPPAATVETYLCDYASHFHLRPHIQFSTSVEDVSYDGAKWVVVTAPTSPDGTVSHSLPRTYRFDLLFVCNGHYSVPRYPSTPGLEPWLLSRRASHSVFYRNPSISGAPFSLGKSHKVLVIGGGPSGQDIVADLHGVVGCIVHSASTHLAVHQDQDESEPALRLRGRPTHFLDMAGGKGKVEFEGGIVEDNIDYCIIATGYQVSFPFFKAPSMSRYLIDGLPPSLPLLPQELFNTTYGVFPLVRHTFPFPFSNSESMPPPSPTSLAFLGLLVRVAPFPLVEAQARAALSAFSHPDRIDWTHESTDIMERYRTLKGQLGLEDSAAEDKVSEAQIQKAWCRFEPMEQFDYRDLLADLVDELDGTSPSHPDGSWMPVARSKSWERELYDHKDVLRRTWRALEASGEAEDWVRGIGTGDHSEEEWVDLMWRVVRKGEGDEKSGEKA